MFGNWRPTSRTNLAQYSLRSAAVHVLTLSAFLLGLLGQGFSPCPHHASLGRPGGEPTASFAGPALDGHLHEDATAASSESEDHEAACSCLDGCDTASGQSFGAPYHFHNPDVGANETGWGNMEIALKFANFAFEDKGLLLGYGLEVGMPTGSDVTGIGSGHIWELEPFLGIGLVTGNFELVNRTRFGIPINQEPGEEVETELNYDFSALYHFSPRFQGLLELNGGIGLSGDDAGEGIVSLSPGIKVAPFAGQALFVGLGASFPLGEEELDARLKLAFFYHFE